MNSDTGAKIETSVALVNLGHAQAVAFASILSGLAAVDVITTAQAAAILYRAADTVEVEGAASAKPETDTVFSLLYEPMRGMADALADISKGNVPGLRLIDGGKVAEPE